MAPFQIWQQSHVKLVQYSENATELQSLYFLQLTRFQNMSQLDGGEPKERRREDRLACGGLRRLTISIHRRREALWPHFSLYVPAARVGRQRGLSVLSLRLPPSLPSSCTYASPHTCARVAGLSEDKGSFSAALKFGR